MTRKAQPSSCSTSTARRTFGAEARRSPRWIRQRHPAAASRSTRARSRSIASPEPVEARTGPSARDDGAEVEIGPGAAQVIELSHDRGWSTSASFGIEFEFRAAEQYAR